MFPKQPSEKPASKCSSGWMTAAGGVSGWHGRKKNLTKEEKRKLESRTHHPGSCRPEPQRWSQRKPPYGRPQAEHRPAGLPRPAETRACTRPLGPLSGCRGSWGCLQDDRLFPAASCGTEIRAISIFIVTIIIFTHGKDECHTDHITVTSASGFCWSKVVENLILYWCNCRMILRRDKIKETGRMSSSTMIRMRITIDVIYLLTCRWPSLQCRVHLSPRSAPLALDVSQREYPGSWLRNRR